MDNAFSDDFVKVMRKIKLAGIGIKDLRITNNFSELEDIRKRYLKVLNMFEAAKMKNSNDIFFFVMYDIQDDKIRGHIAKFLERSGCQRIQMSVFLAKSSRKKYQEIHETLKEVNNMYANEDSIFIVPVGEDILNKLKMLGKNIDFELVMGNKNTLFI